MKVQHVKTIIIVSVLIVGGMIYNAFLTPGNTKLESVSQEEADAALFDAIIDGEDDFLSILDGTDMKNDTLPSTEEDELLQEAETLEQVIVLLEAKQRLNIAIEMEIERLLADINGFDFDAEADMEYEDFPDV